MILFLMLFGGIFFIVGLLISLAFFSFYPFFGAMTFFPVIFMLIGLGVMSGGFVLMKRKRDVIKKGTRYPAKVYGYVDNTSYTVNGQFTVNTKVHFFDQNHVEREVVLDTHFLRNSNMYPIGMTIDIFEYQGKYGYDKNSVRYERLPGEEQLMDNEPLYTGAQTQVAMECKNCGAPFTAVRGYVNRCPYCGGYVNG